MCSINLSSLTVHSFKLDCGGLWSAANPEMLPEPEPRTIREHIVMPSIRSRDVACAEWPDIRHCQDALKALDFSNGLFSVHVL